jgi:hypothetical protein
MRAILLIAALITASAGAARADEYAQFREAYISMAASARAIPLACPGLTLNPIVLTGVLERAFAERWLDKFEAIDPKEIEAEARRRVQQVRLGGGAAKCREMRDLTITDTTRKGNRIKMFDYTPP